MQFFLLLSWDNYFVIGTLSRREIKDQATDFFFSFPFLSSYGFSKEVVGMNYTILVFHMNKKRVAVERGFCEKDSLSEYYCESDIFKWSDGGRAVSGNQ